MDRKRSDLPKSFHGQNMSSTDGFNDPDFNMHYLGIIIPWQASDPGAEVDKLRKYAFSRLPYPVGKSSTIDESFLRWFCGSSVVSYSISISIRVLDHSRTFYRNS